jgi:hypothetical protein
MLTEREEKVVAWLRAQAKYPANGRLIHQLAEAIERGDHLTWKPEPTIPASEWTKTSNVGH